MSVLDDFHGISSCSGQRAPLSVLFQVVRCVDRDEQIRAADPRNPRNFEMDDERHGP